MMSEAVAIRLSFGALSPPLRQQFKDSGVRPPVGLKHLQRDADAITRLAVRGLLSEGEAGRCRVRLAQSIRKDLDKRIRLDGAPSAEDQTIAEDEAWARFDAAEQRAGR